MKKRPRSREGAKENAKPDLHEFLFAPAFAPSCLRGLCAFQAHRYGAIRWSALVFLAVFSILVIIVAYYTLIPGVEAAKDATPQEKRTLVAWYRLLLAVLLFILFAGLAITFRFGRLFFPRPAPPRVKTQYVDAWAESAKRMETPPEEPH